MFKPTPKLWFAIALIANPLLSNSALAQQAQLHKFEHTNVLGTSFEMSIKASTEQADKAQKQVLAEIERLQSVFSSYDANSEVSQLNQHNKPANGQVSADLLTLVKACEQWQKSQPKAFSCRLGKVIDMWRAHEEQQKRPVRPEIRAIARTALESNYSVKDLLAAKSNDDFNWNFGGIAKGYILDQAMSVAKASANDASAIKIDIGGDAVYWQSPQQQKWQVGLAIPNAVDDSNEHLLGSLSIDSGAVAYSGHSSRTYDIARRSYSHILAPRDGWPTHNPVTAIVKAPDATSADALATAFAVNDVSHSLDWLAKHPEYSALLIDRDGRQFASANWYQNYAAQGEDKSQEIAGYQAQIQFTLPKMDVAKYRKPYVAIWITDDKGKMVKNLLLLGTGENWLDQIRSWWRKQGRKSPSLIDGFARPTRRPGQYQLLWDGRDDFGQSVPEGEYRLFAEAVREHGSYEKISLPFQLGHQKQSVSKKGKKEIASLSFKSSVRKHQTSH